VLAVASSKHSVPGVLACHNGRHCGRPTAPPHWGGAAGWRTSASLQIFPSPQSRPSRCRLVQVLRGHHKVVVCDLAIMLYSHASPLSCSPLCASPHL
jgi:hypothetical protein